MMNIIQIVGESATGKSLMCTDLRTQQRTDKWFRDNVLIIDESNLQFLEELDSYIKRYPVIVIDNADELITAEIAAKITASLVDYDNDRMNKWILIGRKPFSCVGIHSVGTLVKKDDPEAGDEDIDDIKEDNGESTLKKIYFSLDYNKKC